MVRFRRKKEIMLWISLNIINKCDWFSTIICLARMVDCVIVQKPLLPLSGEVLYFLALLTSRLALDLLWLMKWVEMIYVYFWVEALSHNLVSHIFIFSLLSQSTDLNRHFSITLRSKIKTCSWAIANPCLMYSVSKE